jgi:hypothetical protein
LDVDKINKIKRILRYYERVFRSGIIVDA